MPRRKLDQISQRTLVYVMRREIDLVPRDPGAIKRLYLLVDANPRSFVSTHVLHNIGKARCEKLSRLMASRAFVARVGPLPYNNDDNR
jgi:hypothetical protein